MVEESMANGQDEQNGLAQQGSGLQGSGPQVNGAAEVPADMVRAFDQEGREVMVPREEWRTMVIPGMLKEAWDDADRLYIVIINSLNEGFVAEVAEAAEHLHAIDTIPGRGACMWAIVLMGTGRADEAEALLKGFAAKHGEDASVLVNLAKIYSDRGEMELAQATLWHAVEVEPNHDNGLGWYTTMAQERGGDQEARAVLEKIRALDGSWRAQLWLARGELNAQNLGRARELYREAIERAPKPLPPDFLMQMTGDLGAKGALVDLIELSAPHFVPEYHGMPVGNNLIKALVDTGNLEPATQVKAALEAQNRPDWKEALGFWDAEIGRRRVAAAPDAQQLQVGMLRVDGPIWLPAGSPARQAFAPKRADAPKVTFLGGSAEAPELAEGEAPNPQIGDALGRMTRSLPLFFAEQTEMRTAAAGRAMVPWAVAPVNGFVVSGQRWPDEAALQAVQNPDNASDYVVSVHVDAEVEPWTALLAFVRTSDGSRIGELEREFDPANPAQGLAELADEVVELLSALGPATPSPAYEVPGPEQFGEYLIRLEQLLAVRCASMENVPAQFLNGETEILEGDLALCYAEPANVPARLLLLATHEALGKLKPEAAQAMTGKIERLSGEHPLTI